MGHYTTRARISFFPGFHLKAFQTASRYRSYTVVTSVTSTRPAPLAPAPVARRVTDEEKQLARRGIRARRRDGDERTGPPTPATPTSDSSQGTQTILLCPTNAVVRGRTRPASLLSTRPTGRGRSGFDSTARRRLVSVIWLPDIGRCSISEQPSLPVKAHSW